MGKKWFLLFFIISVGGLFFFLFDGLWRAAPNGDTPLRLEVKAGDSALMLVNRLAGDHVIRYPRLFLLYLRYLHLDMRIVSGPYFVLPPVTPARIADALAHPEGRLERTITIIPGWNIRDIAAYLEGEGIASSSVIYSITGEPAKKIGPVWAWLQADDLASPLLKDKPADVSLEGYLAPETYRIFADATAPDIIKKLLDERAKQFTNARLADSAGSGRSVHEVLTVASIVEQEVQTANDRKKVADIFWRRLAKRWPLQADSTVHYIVGKKGSVFTTSADRAVDSPWNTYKYQGLPPGPISNPSIESIMAAIFPEKNDFWFFLTTLDGEVKYARTAEEHGRNVAKYLR